MFVLSFIIVVSLVILANNRMKNISSENNDSYEFDKNSRIIIGELFIVSIVLNIIMKNFPNAYIITLVIFIGVSLTGITIANQFRLNNIESRRKDIAEVYEILNRIFKVKPEDIDYNNVPFTILYDKGDSNKVSSIKIEIEEPNSFNDGNLIDGVYRLNEFFNYFQWHQRADFSKREVVFVGRKKPPSLARFQGSDLRPWNWIPLGIGSNGEVAWNLGASKSALGRSMFRFEDTGQLAGTTNVSKAPQCLTLGSTGGGKAIFIGERGIKIK